MIELPNPIGELLTDEVDEARIHRIVIGSLPVSHSANRYRAVWASAAGLVATVALYFWMTTTSDSGPVRLATPTLLPILAAPTDRPLHLELGDGSNFELENDAVLWVLTNERDLVELELVRGRVHFDVRHQTSRRWAIRAGADRIEVVGTRFEVSHERDRVEVRVAEGTVRVVGPNGDRTLVAGQSYRTPPVVIAEAEVAPKTTAESEPAPRPIARVPTKVRTSPEPAREPEATAPKEIATEDWRALANRGAYPPAYTALVEYGVRRVVETADAETLFLAADVARGANDANVAVDLLGALLTRFPHSSLVGLAGTTRARLLLEEINDPKRSAEAFRVALNLDLSPDLLEAALVGRVRALARGEDREATRRAAEDYHRRFPDGRWQKIVEQWVR